MQLPKTAKKIKGSEDYIDIDGTVYYIERRNNHKDIGTVKKKAQHNNQGYQYCGIHYKNGNKKKRVHKLVAEAFIPNPNHYKVVGHRNNIKTDNRVENLYWTTTKENTQKAYDDGLAKNAKGFDDSQSTPVKQYETTTNKLIGEYGSMCEAERITGISKQTIRTQCKYKRPVRKETYFRYFDDETTCNNDLIYCYDYNTDELLGVYFNTVDASKKTQTPIKYVQTCVERNTKPKWTKNQNKYFLRYKCESTIERRDA